jgi:hypothetical protein
MVSSDGLSKDAFPSMAFDPESVCRICAFFLFRQLQLQFFDLDLCIIDDIALFGQGRLEQGSQLEQSGGFRFLCKASTGSLCCYPPLIDQLHVGCKQSRPEDVAVLHQRFHWPAGRLLLFLDALTFAHGHFHGSLGIATHQSAPMMNESQDAVAQKEVQDAVVKKAWHIFHVTCTFITAITVFDTGALRASSISQGISLSRHCSDCKV